MAPDTIIDVMQQALLVALLLSLPPLGLALIIGLVIAVFQAITSIQEQTMVFIPKILATSVALLIFMPWMMASMVDFTRRILLMIPDLVK